MDATRKLPSPAKMQGVKVPGQYIKGAYQRLFGISVSKTWAEIFQVEAILGEVAFDRIVEFGTGSGAMTIFLGICATMQGKPVFTYDTKEVSEQVQHIFSRLNVTSVTENIFEDEKIIGYIIGGEGRTLLYCDNGNKNMEIETFAKYLKPGDVILLHDFPDEVSEADIEAAKKKHGLADWQKEWFMSYIGGTNGSMHRALVKI